MTIIPPFTSRTAPFASIARHAVAQPDKIAARSGSAALTYAEMADRVRRIAAGIAARRIVPGSRIAVETLGTINHLVGLMGVMAAGGIAVALPTDRASYLDICADAAPSLVIATSPNKEMGGAVSDGWPRVDFDEIGRSDISPDAPDPLTRSLEPEEIAMLYYTSGTSSGVRKGVMQSYRQLHNTVHYITAIMQMDSSISEFVASPTDNAFWFGRCRCLLHVGGTALLSAGTLNPLSVVAAINRNEGNAIAGDTAVFLLLLHHMEKHLARLGTKIRWVKIASAPMRLEDKQRIMMILPKARIVFNYGLTEAMRTCLNPLRDRLDKLDTVGRASPSVEVAVVDPGGASVGPGEIGEVTIRGGNLASGYWRKDAMWAHRFRDGWYHSGDLGWMDEEGYLHLQGRMDHAINSGGKTIALSEVETLVRPFLPNTTFAISGMTDPKRVLGEVVVLAVEGRWSEPKSWADTRIKLFEAMEQLLVPVAACLVPRLPRTSNEKVRLSVLRRDIEDGRFPFL